MAFIVMSSFPDVDGFDLQAVCDTPFKAAIIIAALVVLDVANILTYCTAAKHVPVALSSTLNVASNMVVGYIMQVIVFNVALEFLSIFGASLLMLAVVVSSCRCRETEEERSEDPEEKQPLLCDDA
jgi:multidrug transporter EmrE-like cation transporter